MADPHVTPDEAVFLSASVPDPRRDPKYIGTADVTAIREATRALIVVVTPARRLVFGGHPAISPFVLLAAREFGHEDRVTIYVSEYFRAKVPQDNLAFPRIIWTPEVPNDLDASLARMRRDMLDAFTYTAGVFLGGMEGIEQEFALFRARWPSAPAYPVATTGAAAKLLYDAGEGPKDPATRDQLAREYTYLAMFRRLPGVGV